jgi:hypothetical protein
MRGSDTLFKAWGLSPRRKNRCVLLHLARAPEPRPLRYLVVRREDFMYLVPLLEDEHTVFLKTIIPSRKATKQYLGEESDDEA